MKCLMSWSGGKDSALALYRCLLYNDYNIVGLVTTIGVDTNRITMHGVHLELLKYQADSIGLPLHVIELPESCNMDDYESIMSNFMFNMKNNGIEGVVFGDIFLEDVKTYRQHQLSRMGIKAIFPLWGLPTGIVANEFQLYGFKSIITCIDGDLLTDDFVGVYYTKQFIEMLPQGVDVCGENGEFHSFVTDGPIFSATIGVKVMAKIKKEYPNPQGGAPKPFWFADIALSR